MCRVIEQNTDLIAANLCGCKTHIVLPSTHAVHRHSDTHLIRHHSRHIRVTCARQRITKLITRLHHEKLRLAHLECRIQLCCVANITRRSMNRARRHIQTVVVRQNDAIHRDFWPIGADFGECVNDAIHTSTELYIVSVAMSRSCAIETHQHRITVRLSLVAKSVVHGDIKHGCIPCCGRTQTSAVECRIERRSRCWCHIHRVRAVQNMLSMQSNSKRLSQLRVRLCQRHKRNLIHAIPQPLLRRLHAIQTRRIEHGGIRVEHMSKRVCCCHSHRVILARSVAHKWRHILDHGPLIRHIAWRNINWMRAKRRVTDLALIVQIR
mmetsp:Transcript_19879/g.31670  ORF Transcript_19879/g.31670 Transcript_19879/m.31670 type:complete len:323 (+) Transcript_19879:859-1827(+)